LFREHALHDKYLVILIVLFLTATSLGISGGHSNRVVHISTYHIKAHTGPLFDSLNATPGRTQLNSSFLLGYSLGSPSINHSQTEKDVSRRGSSVVRMEVVPNVKLDKQNGVSTVYSIDVVFSGFPTDYVFGVTVGNSTAYSFGDISGSPGPYTLTIPVENGSYYLNLSAVPLNSQVFEPAVFYKTLLIKVNGQSIRVTFSPTIPAGLSEVTFNISGFSNPSAYPLNVKEDTSSETSFGIFQGSGIYRALLPYGNYSVRYGSINEAAYLQPVQFYLSFTGINSSLISFNSSGFLHLTHAPSFKVGLLSSYYIMNVTFNIHSPAEVVNITYYPRYVLSFDLTGPGHNNWNLHIDDRNITVKESTESLYAINGSYAYSVRVPGGTPPYLVTPSNGTVTVGGQSATVKILVREQYLLTLMPSFYRLNSSVTITINGSVLPIIPGTSLQIALPNGSYILHINAPFGFSTSVTVLTWGKPIIFLKNISNLYQITVNGSSLNIGVSIYPIRNSYLLNAGLEIEYFLGGLTLAIISSLVYRKIK